MDGSTGRTIRRDPASVRRAAQGLALLFGILVLLPLVSLSTCILLLIGMLPTVVAFLVDRTPGRFAVAAVGGLNFGAVVPFVLALWFDAPGLQGAFAILTDPFAMVTMYGAAAAGWGLFAGLPALAGLIDGAILHRRIEHLRCRQRELIEEWGPTVVGAEPEPTEGSAAAPETGRRADETSRR